MAMSRKHYNQLAALVVDTRDNGGGIGWRKLAQELADIAAADNPAFDRVKFYNACGVGDLLN